MIIDPKCGSNTVVFVHKDVDAVIEKLGVYTELAKKFIKRNKRYQYIKHVEKLPDGKWVLVFKVLPSNHESIKEYNRIVEGSKRELWINYLNHFIIG